MGRTALISYTPLAGIGLWDVLLKFTASFAVLVNCMIVTVSTDQLDYFSCYSQSLFRDQGACARRKWHRDANAHCPGLPGLSSQAPGCATHSGRASEKAGPNGRLRHGHEADRSRRFRGFSNDQASAAKAKYL